MTTDSLRSLLSGLIDYAGLFPPAKLPMADAVAEYARHRRSDERWMLGHFVVPATRLGELATVLRGVARADPSDFPWSLSALVLPPDLAGDVQRVYDFGRWGALATVHAVETKAATPEAVDAALALLRPLSVPEVYVELPHVIAREPLDALLARVKAGGARAKIRTGGVTADAFPTAAQVAAFVEACEHAGVPFKATAGLHHPLRADYRLTYEPDAPTGTMFGFLNVFVAAACARAGLPTQELVAALEEGDPSAFRFDERGVEWRSHRVDADALARARRDFAIAFGSCSFREPVEDLKKLGLL